MDAGGMPFATDRSRIQLIDLMEMMNPIHAFTIERSGAEIAISRPAQVTTRWPTPGGLAATTPVSVVSVFSQDD
jgi:hypothetical protein